VEEETWLSPAASCFPQESLGGKSAEKLVFLLPTGRNLGGERNIGGTARLFRKVHLGDKVLPAFRFNLRVVTLIEQGKDRATAHAEAYLRNAGQLELPSLDWKKSRSV
jgi:hypothetical protein